MDKSSIENIELRSEEVQEILGQAPRWITRWGITVLFSCLLLFFLLSWFLRYPDIITGTVTIVTATPPASVVAKTSGKIEKLFASNSQQVNAGEVLSIIENPARFDDVQQVKQMLSSFSREQGTLAPLPASGASWSLGELQKPFSEFEKAQADHYNFITLDHFSKKTESLSRQLEKLNLYYSRLAAQTTVLEKDLQLAASQFRRDSVLFVSKVMSEAEYEKAESAFLQKKHGVEGSRSALANCDLQISQLQQQLGDARMLYESEKNRLYLALRESFEALSAAVAAWEQSYILKAPIAGRVTFTKFWSENQNIKAGELAFTIVPPDSGKLVGKITLPVSGSGKVKAGQQVNIKFLNYPYMEYGVVKGKVKSVSLVPADNNYYLELELTNGLSSTYGKVLPFSQEMQGTAEIVTEDLRLLERLLRPVRYVLAQQGN